MIRGTSGTHGTLPEMGCDIDHAVGSSRIFLGARPNKETIQMLVLSPGTVAFARKLVPTGSQEAIVPWHCHPATPAGKRSAYLR